MKKHALLTIATAVPLAIGMAAPAQARGCNGVVNPFVWGCAPWDNNNGPKFPYFKKTEIRIPSKDAKIENKNGAQMVQRDGQWLPVIGLNGGYVVAAGGANAVAAGGAN